MTDRGRITRECPACGGELEIDWSGRQLACTGCEHTEPLPEQIRLQQAGAPRLPGME